MKLLIKVFEHQFVNEIVSQEIIYGETFIEEELNGFGIARFEMPLINIEEDNGIEIYEVENKDVLVFKGFVYKVDPVWKQFGTIKVECRSEKAIFYKREVLNNKSFYNVFSATSLPLRPTDLTEYQQKNPFWLNSSGSNVVSFLGVQTILSTTKYNRGGIPFGNSTVFLIDQNNNKYTRYPDGTVISEGTASKITIKDIVGNLLYDYNLLGENRSYDIDFDDEISINFKQNDNYFDILDEICNQCKALRTIKNSVVIIRKSYFNDLSQGSNYQEITYNGLYPNSSNISNVDMSGTANRKNIITGTDQNGNSITLKNIEDRIYGVGSFDFRDGDLMSKTKAQLEYSNRFQRVYKVEIQENGIYAEIGDKLKLIVENTNSFFDIDSDVIVISKSISYSNGSKIINYSVGEINVQVSNSSNFLYGIQKSIKLLKL